jgi:integrase
MQRGAKEFGPDAYVFGDEVGRRRKSIREDWKATRERAQSPNLQLRDPRHEAGSRFDEAGVWVNYVSKILGHTSLTTTSRYLNIHRRGLQLAMQILEEYRPVVAQTLHTASASAQAVVSAAKTEPSGKQLSS